MQTKPEEGSPAGGGLIWLSTFVAAYRDIRSELTKNWFRTFPLSIFIFTWYVKEINFHTTHNFLKPTVAKCIVNIFVVSICRGKLTVVQVTSMAILRGGLNGPCPPSFLLGPPFGPSFFFLISRLSSFGWHIQGCQMRSVKIPAILSTAPDLSCVVIRTQHRENRDNQYC